MTRSKRKRNQNAVYWRERETEAIRHRIKDEQEYFKEVKRVFDNASVNIDKEIKAFYMRYASKEGITLAEAKKRASQMDIEAFSNKAKRYVKTKDFSDQANEELRLYNLTMKINRLELLKANIGLELVDAYQDLEDITRKAMTERTREELKRQSGILGESINDSKKAVEDIVGQSFYNATFSDRIWHNQTLLKSQLDTLISTGLIQGRNPKALAGELQKVFGTSRYNAERLLITELARVQTQSQQNAYEQCGYEEYQFITIGAGACPICRHMDGRTFKIRDMMVGENAPPLHPNCRCSTSASDTSTRNYDDLLDDVKGFFEDDIRSLIHIPDNREYCIGESSLFQEREVFLQGSDLKRILLKHKGEFNYQEFSLMQEAVVHPYCYADNSSHHERSLLVYAEIPNRSQRFMECAIIERDKNWIIHFHKIRERKLNKLEKENKIVYKKK